MDPINLFIVTFNCGKKEPLNSQFVNSINNKLPSNLSHLYVFGFQEISSLLNSTDDTLILKCLQIISNNLTHCLSQNFENSKFEVISTNSFGSIGLIVISPFNHKITNVNNLIGYPVGYFLTNLKGGVGIKLNYGNRKFSFICMHLNAGDQVNHLLKRNDDLNNILLNLLGNEFNNDPDNYNNHYFLLGDFNYRTTGGFHFNEPLLDSEIDHQDATVEEQLQQKDELLILKKNNIILHNFTESKITFRPSYKFIVGTTKYDSKRKPSYCDRILFDDSKNYEVVEYNTINNCLISDHIPVYLHVNIKPGISSSAKQLKPIIKSNHSKAFDYTRGISYCTTKMLRLLLILTTTFKGRLILVLLLIRLVYLLCK